MKINYWRLAQSLLLWASLSVSSNAATLQWNANPEPDVAFYTVYAESSAATNVFAVENGTVLVLDGLLANGSYMIYVTATSSAGLESERSQGLAHTVGAAIAAPLITAQPADMVRATGATIALAVTATGAGTLSFEWRKDGQVLAGKTSANLSITNASVGDSGLYTVVVSNSGGSVSSNPARVEVQVPPSIQAQPQSVAVPLGTGAVLSVSASGSALRYEWRKNNVAISGQTNATFSIFNAAAADAANYRVVISNLVGSTTSAVAAVTIVYPPTIASAPAGTNVATGGTIQLGVSASGTGPFTYQWLKGGVAIAGATGSSLTIVNAAVSDAGSYQARVSNAAGSVTSAAATVAVLNPPSIVTQPAGKDVLDGSLLELTVTANGSGTLAYQWFRNGSAIAGGSGALFQVSSASASNAGDYSVVVSNAVGTAQSQVATVRVLPRITITQQPASTNLQIGGRLDLAVQATGPSPLTYQWYRGAQALSGATSAQFSIASLSSGDAGSYTVRLSSSLETVTSAAALVSILQEAPTIVAQPQSAAVVQGQQITLSVTATGTGLSYQWLKNDVNISGAVNAMFSIASFTGAEAGSYRVQVSNASGSVLSDVATLTLISPVSIVEAPASTNLATGGTIQLGVSTSGTAPFTYQWLKGGMTIAGATGSSLTIANAAVSDSGSYQARVSNAAGSVTSSSATVAVLNPPSIVTQLAGKDVLDGSLLELTVTANGSGTLAYQWFRNGSAMAGGNGALFRVSSASASDAGDYSVVVSNAVGTVQSQVATVRVLPRITITQQPASTNLQVGGRLDLAVQATGPSPLTYQWYRGTQALSGATNAQFSILSLSSGNVGSYTVRISSSLETVTSAAALVGILQEPPSIVSQPLSAAVGQGRPLSLSVTATGTALTYQWLKNDVNISGAVNATFSIASFTAADAGSYRVRVSNSFGSVLSDAAIVSVSVAPSILEAPLSTNVAVGGTIELAVAVTGTAPFTFEWLRNGVALSNATNITLSIPAAKTNDAGLYQVRVTNGAGYAVSGAANVVVIEAPKIIAQPSGGTVVEGTRFTTTVGVSSAVPVTYQWLKDGLQISGATSSTFDKAAVVLTDAGSYTVRITSMAGAVTSGAAQLQVTPAITILEPPTGTNVTNGGSVNLKVKAGGPGSLNYQWYKNGVKINGKNSSELIIPNATLADAGTYTVEITSDGQRVMSSPVQVTINEIQAATLTLSTASDGALRVSGVAPANTNYELQRTDSLSPANWRRIQNVSTRADGRFEVVVPISAGGSGFIRTVRR